MNGKLETLLGGNGGKPKAGLFVIIGGAVVAIWLSTGIYLVGANERAVVTTFGAYTTTTGPGPHYRLPGPIQRHQKVPVTTLQRTDVGGTEAAHIEPESLMLTGDENIVDLQFTVQWRISDPEDYLFNLRDPQPAVKAVAESSMREVVGRNALIPILTTSRGQVQTQVADLMQRVLDSYGAGVTIDEVQIRGASPPPPVVDSFRDVQSANQDFESKINTARGQAAQIEQAALGYRAQTIREAEGEAAAFNQVYTQYKLAPAVTRQRMYIDTMQDVLEKSNKIIVDNNGASAPIILPPEALRPRAPTTPSLTPGATR